MPREAPIPSSPPAKDTPHVPASVSLPEITVKAVTLGIILSMALAAANAYLGLFAGMTVSASIPAAVISMAVLRLFREHNILENNIVQTAASAGESLAAGVIFTLPALVVLGAWNHFDYVETTMLAGLGGVIGVAFTIPLRRALIVESDLKFPEGVATAEVLQSGEEGGSAVKYLVWSALIGAVFKFGEAGLQLWTATVERAKMAGGWLLYGGSNLSPALVAVGYIVGLNIAVLVFAGGAISWLIGIPVWVLIHGTGLVPEETIAQGVPAAANWIWGSYIRYMGIGAMVVGGLWAIVNLRGSLMSGIRSGIDTYRHASAGTGPEVLRTEKDTPMPMVLTFLVLSVIPIFIIYSVVMKGVGVSILMSILMLIAGFLFSAVAAYMAGLVGSSNNPISGVTIATILSASLLLLVLVGSEQAGAAGAIIIGAVVCCAAAIAGDNMQDLKAGHIVGATPWKQQTAQILGTVTAAFVMAPILTLLLKGYGFGPHTPEHPNSLTAPQATLMASVAQGVFEHNLPWAMAGIGAVIAIAIIAFDQYQASRGAEFRTPVLAVAVGIYLPLSLSVPIFIGGLVAHAAAKTRSRMGEAGKAAERFGLLFASGLITGEAMVGILLAIPLVAFSRNVFALTEAAHFAWPGMILLVGVLVFLYRSATAKSEPA